ncbi:hypothetical protein Tco_0451519 [Tanacetum coccineum]
MMQPISLALKAKTHRYLTVPNGNPEEDLKDYAIIDSGCSGSMTGDKDKFLIFKSSKLFKWPLEMELLKEEVYSNSLQDLEGSCSSKQGLQSCQGTLWPASSPNRRAWSMIGYLMYLTASRPDIMFAVCLCARFQVTPKVSHLHAVKRIFRYDYAWGHHDRRSTQEYVNILGRRLVSLSRAAKFSEGFSKALQLQKLLLTHQRTASVQGTLAIRFKVLATAPSQGNFSNTKDARLPRIKTLRSKETKKRRKQKKVSSVNWGGIRDEELFLKSTRFKKKIQHIISLMILLLKNAACYVLDLERKSDVTEENEGRPSSPQCRPIQFMDSEEQPNAAEVLCAEYSITKRFEHSWSLTISDLQQSQLKGTDTQGY